MSSRAPRHDRAYALLGLQIITAVLMTSACVPNDTATKPRKKSKSARKAPRAKKLPKASKKSSATARKANRDPLLSAPFEDRFERKTLGNQWRTTSSRWKIEDGRLCVNGAKNHPAWLARRLPTNARIEFDATSYSSDGDLKVELWGDGFSSATGASYTNASSYLAIFGGWKNRYHVLARLDEHAPDRPQIDITADGPPRARPVVAGTTYRFGIERTDGATVRWRVDGLELFSYTDRTPLRGLGHDHVGFNDWAAKVCFDNLAVTPLDRPGEPRP